MLGSDSCILNCTAPVRWLLTPVYTLTGKSPLLSRCYSEWVNFGLLFREQNFSTRDITHTFCRRTTKFGSVRGLANGHLLPEFREVWSGHPVIPCGDMHQSFSDVLVKWFFDNFPMFADSFRLVSIHCVAR